MTSLRHFLPGAEPPREETAPEDTDDDILGRPAVPGGGGTPDLYRISSLAAALRRSPGTIRDWERAGIIPRGYVLNDESRNGRRRLYSRQQILMLRQLAAECGILDDHRATVKGSEFSRLAFILFDRLRDEAA